MKKVVVIDAQFIGPERVRVCESYEIGLNWFGLT